MSGVSKDGRRFGASALALRDARLRKRSDGLLRVRALALNLILRSPASRSDVGRLEGWPQVRSKRPRPSRRPSPQELRRAPQGEGSFAFGLRLDNSGSASKSPRISASFLARD